MALMQYMGREGRPFCYRPVSRCHDASHRRGDSICRNSRRCRREELAIMIPIFAAFFVPQVSLLLSFLLSHHIHIYIYISYYVQKPIFCFNNHLCICTCSHIYIIYYFILERIKTQAPPSYWPIWLGICHGPMVMFTYWSIGPMGGEFLVAQFMGCDGDVVMFI